MLSQNFLCKPSLLFIISLVIFSRRIYYKREIDERPHPQVCISIYSQAYVQERHESIHGPGKKLYKTTAKWGDGPASIVIWNLVRVSRTFIVSVFCPVCAAAGELVVGRQSVRKKRKGVWESFFREASVCGCGWPPRTMGSLRNLPC